MATLKLNREELIRRRQDLIRQGQKVAFTAQVKPRNTPQGAGRPPAKFLKHCDSRQRYLDRRTPAIKADLSRIIPKEILLGHAVNVTRRHMALRPDYLVRSLPTLDQPRPSKRATPRKTPEGLTPAEKKLFKKMTWFKLGYSDES